MEVDDENIVTRKCIKLEQPIYDNLSIVYNSSNSMLVLWNKYQIFIYENLELERVTKIVTPQFQIKGLIAFNNYIVCLDSRNDLQIASLKFKSTTQQKLNLPFQMFEKDIKTSISYKEEFILSLKNEAGSYSFYLHRLTPSLKLEKIVKLLTDDLLRQNTTGKYLLVYHAMQDTSVQALKNLFKIESEKITYDLMVLSIDNFSVYGCLFNPKMDESELKLVNLYSCPAEICNLEVLSCEEQIYLIITLRMGTVIRITLNDVSKTANIVNFNTSLHKALVLKDSIMYTDGMTLWKSENTFNEAKFTQFFVQDTNDFLKCGDQIICTTFTKLLYTFFIDDEKAVITSKLEENCEAEKLLSNIELINQIFAETDKNADLVKKISSEQDYICALALSKKQNVVEKAISTSVVVYEDYEDVVKSNLILTENLQEYFDPKNWLFLVKITNLATHNFIDKILSNLSECVRVYITFSTDNLVLKTTMINMEKPMKMVVLLLPLDIKNYNKIDVNIKVLLKIPGAIDKKPIWTVLYKKDAILKCEHFIKTFNKNMNVLSKNPTESIEEIICKNNLTQYGSMFEFKDKQNRRTEWSFYIKLPDDYKKQLKNPRFCLNLFNPVKATYILEKLCTKEFIDAKDSIHFIIGEEKYTIKIQNDGFTQPLLVVCGTNIKKTHDLRMFLSNMLYNDYNNEVPGKEYISTSFYTATENLQKAVKECITKASFPEFISIMDKFEKHFIGILPL